MLIIFFTIEYFWYFSTWVCTAAKKKCIYEKNNVCLEVVQSVV